ncbi:MAG TPA: phage tail protein [Candidatus Polarisedimenticolia bacterium]|jgi:phage tail-like protein|nr:phage tail protein [Candidatus Polarisedimenticolia bacterium]
MSLTLFRRFALLVLVLGAATLTLPAAFRTAAPQDALTAARFSLLADGREIAAFTELQEISSSVELVEGSEPRLIPNVLVLSRPLSGLEFTTWQDEVLEGGAAGRKTCSLVMYDYDGSPVARFYLEDAWPSKVGVETSKAGASKVLIERVTISAARIRRALLP